MQLRHISTVHQPSGTPAPDLGRFPHRIACLAWSNNNLRLAVGTAERSIMLYDEDGTFREKLPTKPSDPNGPKSYSLRGLEFSPDSTKLAVAQSDNIVFVYKLGKTWGEKKTICNKFPNESAVTAMTWPHQRHNELVFGGQDGKVRCGNLKSNKFSVLYQTNSYVVSMCSSPDGTSFLSGHGDGTIYRYTFSSDDRPQQVVKLYTCKFVPYALGWGQHILAAGNSSQVISISTQGQQIQEFDYSSDPQTKEFTCASVNPAGHTIVLGNYDRFYVYVYNASKDCWEEAAITTVSNLLTVTALRWKSDGSRLVTGSLGGYVDTYDACIRRYTYKGEWEFTYTSLSSVIIKRLSSGSRHPLNSRFQCEITKINIYADRFVVAHTSDTLMMMDTQRNLVSEVRWNFYGGANEKFYFDNENACMIYKQGELTLVEYGKNEILGECRTEYMSPFLISLRLNEGRTSREEPIKVIAYLLDMQSIRIQDLARSVAVANINHDCKIDWLELNQRGTKLLFRDKRRALHLYDVVSQTRVTLLTVCNYVQWVPDSDVVVAQSRHQLCVWYSIHNPSDKTIINIKGDVEQIERAPGRTDVIVDEGIHRATYPLDEALIAFGAAIDAHDYQRAVATLEALPAKSKGAEAMWTHLGKLALEEGGFVIAERCFSALGDVGKTKYLNKINHIIAANGGNKDHYMVKAHIYMLNKEVKRAEACLLQYGNVDEVILMYRQLHKWDEALRVAESKNHPHVAQLRAEYYTYLLATKQEEIAGELKEKQGDYADALQLYLRGGFPARAADLVLSQNITQDTGLCERVASALLANKNYEKAGEFLENIKLYDRALKAYQKGHAYHKAVELCRHAFPAQVVGLEEAWGDYLASTKQMDAACNHYIQAGAYLKAINAAIDARQGTKAAQILDQLEPGTAKPFFRRVAMYFSETNKLTEAEKYFLAGGFPQDAVAMYTSVGAWDKAHSIASTYMPPEEVSTLYVTQAQKQEAAGKWKDAERLYIAVQEPDLAISMYKKNRQYDEMIRLVTQHRKELLNETHALLARQFETEGNFKQAEQHYIKSKDWSPAVRMYKENEMWEDVLRVAKTHGDMEAYKFWAFEVARGVGGDAGTKLLVKYGVAEFAVDYAIEKLDFGMAMSIAEKACKHKIQDVHYHLAMALEDEGKFAKAEDEFIKSKKPKEAIEMYIHQRAWDDAIRVAETHDPTLLPEISEAQGKLKLEEKNYVAAEGYFIAAKKPEIAIKMYQEAGSWDDAIRVAKTHAPRLVQHIQSDRMQALSTTDVANTGDFLVQQAKMLVQSKQYSAAIDAYLKLNKTHTPNLDELQRIYETALSLAIEYVRPRAIEVAQIVSKKLTEMNRWEAAADVLVHVDSFQAAIDLCIQAKLYDKAKQIAMNEAPQLRTYVDKAYQEHLVGSNKLNVLGDVNPDMAIDMYQARGEWNKVYELAAKQGDAAIQRYSAMHVQACIKDEKYKQALQVLLKNGTPIIEANFQLYKRVAQEILAGSDRSERTGTTKNSSSNETLLELREMLFKLVHELSEIDPHSQYTAEFERLLFIAHLCALRYTCLSMDLRPLSAKIAISLLRYTTEVPVDKAFYDAGLACKEQGWLNNAFVFWNRFVDLTDLMANPDSGDIDNTDFLATDIPSPLHVPLPKEQSLSEDVREEVREWVLDQAMAETGQQLTQKHCDKCSKETYEASLNCHNCRHQYQPCIVTGFPIRAGGRVQCRSCKKDANKDDWNKYVVRMKTCPWCGTLQNPAY